MTQETNKLQFTQDARRTAYNLYTQFFAFSREAEDWRSVDIVAAAIKGQTSFAVNHELLQEILEAIGHKDAAEMGVCCCPRYEALVNAEAVNAMMLVETNPRRVEELFVKQRTLRLGVSRTIASGDDRADISALCTIAEYLLRRHAQEDVDPDVRKYFDNMTGKMLRVPVSKFTVLVNAIGTLCGAKSEITSGEISKICKLMGYKTKKGYAQGLAAITYIDRLFIPIFVNPEVYEHFLRTGQIVIFKEDSFSTLQRTKLTLDAMEDVDDIDWQQTIFKGDPKTLEMLHKRVQASLNQVDSSENESGEAKVLTLPASLKTTGTPPGWEISGNLVEHDHPRNPDEPDETAIPTEPLDGHSDEQGSVAVPFIPLSLED